MSITNSFIKEKKIITESENSDLKKLSSFEVFNQSHH